MTDVRSSQQFKEEQLPMFVSAREVRETYTPGDAPIASEHEELWDRKLAESQGRSTSKWAKEYAHLYESIRQHGVQSPVWAGVSPSGAKTLWEGHHRIASQYEADPERLVPILHGRSVDRATEDMEGSHVVTSSLVRNMIANQPTQPTTSHRARSFRRKLMEINANSLDDEDDPNYPPMASPSERNRYYNELGFDKP